LLNRRTGSTRTVSSNLIPSASSLQLPVETADKLLASVLSACALAYTSRRLEHDCFRLTRPPSAKRSGALGCQAINRPPCRFHPRREIPARPKVRFKMRAGMEASPHGSSVFSRSARTRCRCRRVRPEPSSGGGALSGQPLIGDPLDQTPGRDGQSGGVADGR
jgi:hypothetical protein